MDETIKNLQAQVAALQHFAIALIDHLPAAAASGAGSEFQNHARMTLRDVSYAAWRKKRKPFFPAILYATMHPGASHVARSSTRLCATNLCSGRASARSPAPGNRRPSTSPGQKTCSLLTWHGVDHPWVGAQLHAGAVPRRSIRLARLPAGGHHAAPQRPGL